MSDFPIAQLGELAKPERAAIAIGPFGSRMKADVYVPIGVPVIRGTNISSDRSLKGNWVYVPEDFAATMPACALQSGDLVFPHRGSIGEVALIEQSHVPMVISSSMMKFRPDPRRLDSRFAYYFFKSQPGREEILRFGSQVGTPGIGQPLASLKQFRIPLPPLEQQKAIASILGALDDKIELNRKMNETLEAMARALFKDWFVDFGPTRAKMEGRAPYLAPDIWSLFPDRLDDEGKPEGWMEKPLTKFFEIVGGGTPKTSESGYWGGDIPWFSVVDTPSGSDIFVFETEKSITDDGLRNSSARLLDRGGTIISARGTVGNLAMVGRPMAFNQSCYGLKGANGYGPCFVFLAAKHMVAKLQSLAHGSVFSTITRQTFDSVYLPAPGIYVAKQFDLVASALFERMRANVAESHTLAATRDFLLPKLMSGEVRIKDAATLVGEVT
ncbi:restriction endonuclease subunit S [Tistrella bauzanensis]|uniref:restriction endonuclease subunit S n=1 Tax=Tistrella TaxID=171436 RepID=UPI0031F6705D